MPNINSNDLRELEEERRLMENEISWLKTKLDEAEQEIERLNEIIETTNTNT